MACQTHFPTRRRPSTGSTPRSGRIEAAINARAESGAALARRHAALKARMAEAVAALDDVITRSSAN
ncbi:hypothetical protein [Sphingomonas sp. 22R3R2A-7]|uniref:hypothetical protein n=1 Tax=Sphingomonas sp. 22R3R2A-7 TaxID=3050230 RepID=UPI002FE14458